MDDLSEEKPLSIDDVKLYSLRTITGDKVMCSFVFNSENKTFVMYYPIAIRKYYDPEENGIRTMFEKYNEETDDVISVIVEPHVVSISILNQQFRKYYLKALNKFYFNKEEEEVNKTFSVEGTNTVN